MGDIALPVKTPLSLSFSSAVVVSLLGLFGFCSSVVACGAVTQAFAEPSSNLKKSEKINNSAKPVKKKKDERITIARALIPDCRGLLNLDQSGATIICADSAKGAESASVVDSVTGKRLCDFQNVDSPMIVICDDSEGLRLALEEERAAVWFYDRVDAVVAKAPANLSSN